VQEAARAEGAAGGQPEPAAAPGGGHGACPECEAALVGDYCHLCGGKRPEARDLTVRHFFSEAAQELTSVEHSKLFHTIWALLFRPGFLTVEWIAGRRRRYLKPLNLYLGVFALSLFAFSVYKPVSLYNVEKFVHEGPNPAEAVRAYGKLAERKRVTLEVFFERINEKWQRYMSLSSLPLIGAFALVLQVVFLFSRRYFVEHLVFSMHYISFTTLFVVLLWPLYFFIGIRPGRINIAVAVLKWLLDVVYLFFAVRAVYGLGRGRTLLAAVLLLVGYFICYALSILVTLFAAVLSAALS
jgi:hypothetical protein